MKNESNVKKFYNIAIDSALEIVEREARKILKKHTNLAEFVMGMGGWTFWRKDGNAQDEETAYLKPIRNFIARWDESLKLTGTPMRFTATGPKVTSWGIKE